MVVKGWEFELMARETMIPERMSVIKCYDYIFKTNKSSVWFCLISAPRLRTFIITSGIVRFASSSVSRAMSRTFCCLWSSCNESDFNGKVFLIKHQVVLV